MTPSQSAFRSLPNSLRLRVAGLRGALEAADEMYRGGEITEDQLRVFHALIGATVRGFWPSNVQPQEGGANASPQS